MLAHCLASNQEIMNTSRIRPSAEVRYEPLEIVKLIDRRETVRVATNTMRLRLYTHNGLAESSNITTISSSTTTGNEVEMSNSFSESQRIDTVNIASTPTVVPDSIVGTVGLVDRQEQLRQQAKNTEQQQLLADARAAADQARIDG